LAAGATKLRQPAWPATAAAFGAPGWVALVLPWVELILGGLLAAGVGLPWTALGAAGLVGGFTAAVALRVAGGRAVPCGCFGETSPEPVGADTLIRNLVLLALAGATVAAGRASAGPVEAALGAAGGLLFVVVARARPGRGR
ncbi:MAG: MauE/DoxX family redox-associated membrane protein, partial [Acidimicrobiales bacterium]